MRILKCIVTILLFFIYAIWGLLIGLGVLKK